MWAWGIADIKSPDDVEIDNTLDGFIDRISRHNSACYFHNLKWDGHFILDWLLKHGYTHTTERTLHRMEFSTLISNMGKFYSIKVMWGNGVSTEFRDSLKKLPMSVKRIAKSFKLAEGKGEIDYHEYRAPEHVLTPEEADYLRRDVSIIAHAMQEVLANGMTKLTVGSDALAEYKRITGDKHFDRLFPILDQDMDAEIRRAYRGGFTYADPRFKSRIQRSGLVLDVNSLYPYVMTGCWLPWGEPEFIEGHVTPTASMPLVIFSVTFTAKLKRDHIPCIQIKGSSMFGATEYLSEISEPTTLMVTNIDWDLYNDHYDIDVHAYGGGWRFHAAQGMFDTYIDKWAKIKASETGGKRELAKLQLNSLYGKFATNPHIASKIPVLKDGAVKLVAGADETRAPVYTAVGVFITSYARDLTIRSAQENYATFAYADTDSLHLLQDHVPETIDVHPTKLGAWKLEYHFNAAFYIRPKAYLERRDDLTCEDHELGHADHGEWCHYTSHIAGLPEPVVAKLTFDHLEHGRVLHGKRVPKAVPGGVVLKDVPFELKL